MGVILAVIIPGILFVLLFPEFVLQVVAGDKYMDAVPLLRLTMLYGLLIPFARQFGVIMDSMGKPQINFFMVVASAALNVVFNFLFISQFGIIGAAYATLTTLFLLFVANQYILYKEIGSSPFNAILYSQKVYANGFRLLWNKVVIRDKANLPGSIIPTTKSEPDAQQGS
ncbi:MAG: polysaccharide biosynthesis C-terminal domain-containing protein [Bacteroidota bacterium]